MLRDSGISFVLLTTYYNIIVSLHCQVINMYTSDVKYEAQIKLGVD